MPPPIVQMALDRAHDTGFAMSSVTEVGELLAVLAAAVPQGGRVLELGTGSGVGLAWIVHGVGDRSDVEVVSVELDQEVAEHTRSYRWPAFVRIEIGDAPTLVPELGTFDLVFADAEGGKWEGLDGTVAALRPGGYLLVDDMAPAEWGSDHHRTKTAEVRERLTTDANLVAVELACASGLILCTKLST